MFEKEKMILPAFPRTPHLYKEGMSEGDILLDLKDVPKHLTTAIEEKIDGASVGMALVGDYPVIRNRTHILRKGYIKDTKAKKQFAFIWTWFYQNKDKFIKLSKYGTYSVYGEWVLAMHTLYYDLLPDIFIAYDLYDYSNKTFLSTLKAREILNTCGFSIPPLLYYIAEGFDFNVRGYLNTRSEYSSIENIEGLYIKMCTDNAIVQRIKVIRPGFVQDDNWLETTLTKNELKKS